MDEIFIRVGRRAPMIGWACEWPLWEAVIIDGITTYHGVNRTPQGAIENLLEYMRQEHGWDKTVIATVDGKFLFAGRL